MSEVENSMNGVFPNELNLVLFNKRMDSKSAKVHKLMEIISFQCYIALIRMTCVKS